MLPFVNKSRFDKSTPLANAGPHPFIIRIHRLDVCPSLTECLPFIQDFKAQLSFVKTFGNQLIGIKIKRFVSVFNGHEPLYIKMYFL